MRKNIKNIYVDQGMDFEEDITLLNLDDSAYNITDESFSCSVKKLYSYDVVFQASSVSQLSGDANNVISLVFTANTTINTDAGKYQYDVVMEKGDGTKTKIQEGLLILNPTITT